MNKNLCHQFGVKLVKDESSDHHALIDFLELLILLYADLYDAQKFERRVSCYFLRRDSRTPSPYDGLVIKLPVPTHLTDKHVTYEHFCYVTEHVFSMHPIASKYFKVPAMPSSYWSTYVQYSEISIFLPVSTRMPVPLPPRGVDLLNLSLETL